MSALLASSRPAKTFDTITQLVAALAAHRAGRMTEAEAGYRDVLAVEPGHPSALRLLGMLLLAVDRAPEAIAALEAAVAAKPDDPESRTTLANALAADGATVAAIAQYRAVLATWPRHHAARVNLANALRDTGDAAGAIAECRLALATAPRLIEAHITLGASLLAAGRAVEAIGAYRTAVAIDAASPLARTGFALALLRDRRAVDALDAALRVCMTTPDYAEAWFARGAAERALERFADARTSLERAVHLAPAHSQARLALGNTLVDLDDLAGGEREIRAAMAADPTIPEAPASLGFVLAAQGHTADAVAACTAAIALRPDFARAHWNRSTAHLLAGDYAAGFADYEWRRRDPMFAADFPTIPSPAWRGDDITGQTLLVMAEQGFGDAIQFARYIPLLADRGIRVVMACAAPLVPLFRAMPGLADVVATGSSLPPHDRHVFQMSLPLLCGTTSATIPAATGYLTADPARVNWPITAGPVRVGPITVGPIRVGLAWAGNPAHHNDARRSLPTRDLAPLADLPNIAWHNLQIGGRGAELAIMHRMPAPPSRIADFADTAALIATLDLVITADTAVAHLAGALGKPVWIMLPHAPDWRWMLGRDDSPWYASARLFRQGRPGDWPGVIARVAVALGELQPIG